MGMTQQEPLPSLRQLIEQLTELHRQRPRRFRYRIWRGLHVVWWIAIVSWLVLLMWVLATMTIRLEILSPVIFWTGLLWVFKQIIKNSMETYQRTVAWVETKLVVLHSQVEAALGDTAEKPTLEALLELEVCLRRFPQPSERLLSLWEQRLRFVLSALTEDEAVLLPETHRQRLRHLVAHPPSDTVQIACILALAAAKDRQVAALVEEIERTHTSPEVREAAREYLRQCD